MVIRNPGWLTVVLFALLLAACGGGGGGDGGTSIAPAPAPTPDPDPPMFEGLNVVNYPMGDTMPVNDDSPFVDVLQDCVFSNDRVEPCTLATLPLLGQETDDPGLEDVLDRVIVSHAWMVPRMREIIENMPDDLKLLMRSVTAMVVSTDIRPAFYWTATGAIYIDADFVWMTPQECADIPTDEDFRAGFGRDLRFIMPARFVHATDGSDAFLPSRQAGGACPTTPRGLDQILPNIGRLLYHELAHANDFFPPDRHATLGSGRPGSEIRQPIISDMLTSQMGLESSEMRALAGVRFLGNTATSAQRAVMPEDVAGWFPPDGAAHFYGYSTTREDLAMLFEALMLRFHFGIVMDHAVTNNWNHEDVSCPSGRVPDDPECDLIVAWGERNRLGDLKVRERARFVMARLLPEHETELGDYITTLPAPVRMVQGESWFHRVFEGTDPSLMRELLIEDNPHEMHSFETLPPYR